MQRKEDSVKNGVSTVTLDTLITAALTEQPYNQPRLGREARLYARRLSKAYGKDLTEDQHEEVFGQAFVELFQADRRDLATMSGKAMFRRAVRSAVRVVRASYTAPGQRTRSKKGAVDKGRVAAEHIGQMADARTLERCTVGEGTERTIDFDLLPNIMAATEAKQVEDRLEIEGMLAGAPTTVATALRLIYMNEEPVTAVAADLKLSRFTLNRQIEAYCKPWRAAA
jgi:hypothetical protein